MFYNEIILRYKKKLKYQRKRGIIEMNKKMRNERGITLIALVVTIVVLLILAGVSISLILDNNGIIQKSKDAKREYGQARENEQADLNNISTWIEKETENNEPEIVEPENIDDWRYIEEEDGTITITQYSGNETEIIIPNYINGKAVKKIKTGRDINLNLGLKSFWDATICKNSGGYLIYQDSITKVTISEGIEIIDDWTFFDSVALQEIIIPNTVKSIGERAFFCCTNLENVTVLKNVTTLKEYVFAGIPSITVNVPFKEGETPEGWDENWNATVNDTYTVTVNYAK